MILDRVIIDLCALLLAPELQVKLLCSQLDKDGLLLCCFADLPRENLRRALKAKQYLQFFDVLLYPDALLKMDSHELRQLNSASTLWLRTPDMVNYKLVLPYLSPRRRMLPKVLRTLVDRPLTLDEGLE